MKFAIVFYRIIDGKNDLLHAITGFDGPPTIHQDHEAYLEFVSDILPKLQIVDPVYSIKLPEDKFSEIMGFGS